MRQKLQVFLLLTFISYLFVLPQTASAKTGEKTTENTTIPTSEIPLKKKWDVIVGVDYYKLSIDLGQKGWKKKAIPIDYSGTGLNVEIVPFHDIFGSSGFDIGFGLKYIQNGHESSAQECQLEYCIQANSNLKFRILTLSTLFYIPISRSQGRLDFTASAGIGHISYKLNRDVTDGDESESEALSDKGFFVPLGVGFNFTPRRSKFSFRAEYMLLHKKGGNKSDIWTLGVRYGF
ncbi:MAG: hypothetical protein BMS9Abin13_132 [Patescibacteria group bacterium]|nr:MAG: hypothetical protein BMS9Abin13_132 [Patescibacteria group bacterium]